MIFLNRSATGRQRKKSVFRIFYIWALRIYCYEFFILPDSIPLGFRLKQSSLIEYLRIFHFRSKRIGLDELLVAFIGVDLQRFSECKTVPPVDRIETLRSSWIMLNKIIKLRNA